MAHKISYVLTHSYPSFNLKDVAYTLTPLDWIRQMTRIAEAWRSISRFNLKYMHENLCGRKQTPQTISGLLDRAYINGQHTARTYPEGEPARTGLLFSRGEEEEYRLFYEREPFVVIAFRWCNRAEKLISRRIWPFYVTLKIDGMVIASMQRLVPIESDGWTREEDDVSAVKQTEIEASMSLKKRAIPFSNLAKLHSLTIESRNNLKNSV